MNTPSIQLIPAANAAAESATKSRPADSGQGETSFRDVLKGEVNGRRSPESASSQSAGKGDMSAKKTDARDSAKTGKEKDESETAAVAAAPEDMAQLLALASQIAQPPTSTDATAAAGAAAAGAEAIGATVAQGGMPGLPGLAAEKSPEQAPVEPASAGGRSTVLTDSLAEGNKPDFAAQLGQATLAQQPAAGVSSENPHPDLAAIEGLAAAAQSAAPAGEAQPVQGASLVALQQAGMEHAGKLSDPSSDRIAPRVATPAWGQAVGQKIVWMAGNEQQSASLSLNPPDLGPLQVVIRVSESTATANFVSAHPEVRQALEAAMPRLREMLGEAGIQLGQAQVGAGTSGDYAAPGQPPASRPGTGASDASYALPQEAEQPVRIIRRGLVDTFA